MNREEKIRFILQKAHDMRVDSIEMGWVAGGHGAHFGPALGCMDAVACLYFGVMNYDAKNPEWEGRDRFVLSKGHACLAYYAALVEAGFVPREEMSRFKCDGTYLSGHPSCHMEYGMEVATGSLGNGFAVACGMALAGKIKKAGHRVFCVVGDGECNEGLIWEAAMNAVKNGLDNFVTVIDRNGFQLAGRTHEIMDLDLEAIWRAFGWDVQVVADGNDVGQLLDAMEAAVNRKNGKPQLLIANSVKGKGISFMEDNLAWHAAPLSREQYEQAMSELGREPGGNHNG